jgi:hypothetical protein
VVPLKSTTLSTVKLYSLVEVCCHFRGTLGLKSKPSRQQPVNIYFFDPEDRGSMLL